MMFVFLVTFLDFSNGLYFTFLKRASHDSEAISFAGLRSNHHRLTIWQDRWVYASFNGKHLKIIQALITKGFKLTILTLN